MPYSDPEAWARLDAQFRRERPLYTLSDVVERTGLRAELVRRIWRALGFAIPVAGERAFSTGDVAALELFADETLDFETRIRVARSLGQTIPRLADWQMSTFRSYVEEIEASDARSGGLESTARRIADAFDEGFEVLLIHVWRRHISAAVARASVVVGDDHGSTLTVGFADLVQFSALSNELTEDRIADLVEIFETRASDNVANLGGRVIKTLGDSVLFVTETAVMGMEIAQRLTDVIGHDSRLPDVRIGLATGPVIQRFGDVYGPAVNLAARLTGIARRNRVIIDAVTAQRLPEDRYETRALTARPVRGFGVLEPVAVRRL